MQLPGKGRGTPFLIFLFDNIKENRGSVSDYLSANYLMMLSFFNIIR
jgi:hypothetical protein